MASLAHCRSAHSVVFLKGQALLSAALWPAHRAQGMAALEQLVRTVVDVLRHRVEANLAAVAATRLLDLPSQRAVGHEEFVACQAAFLRKQAAALAIR